jgi:hypothetical protein
MARWRAGRRTSYSGHVAVASEAERAQAKQIIIARVDTLEQIPILTNITGLWPRRGQVVAFHLDIARGGKPKALMFAIPVTAPDSMLKTEITVTTGAPPQDAIPVAQFRNLCFYRVINKMREWLEQAEPEDEKDVLHFMALFEHQVKDAMRRRTLTLTPQITGKWRRYKGVRTLYMEPGTDGERNASRVAVVRIVKSFMTEMNGGGA